MEYDVLNILAENMPHIIRSDAELLSSIFWTIFIDIICIFILLRTPFFMTNFLLDTWTEQGQRSHNRGEYGVIMEISTHH